MRGKKVKRLRKELRKQYPDTKRPIRPGRKHAGQYGLNN